MLGQYAVVVLSSWAIGIVLVAGLVWQSIARFRRIRDELEQIEGEEGR